MTKPNKLQIIAVTLILLAITLFGVNALLEPASCGNKVFSRVVSPNQRYIAETYERGCGATVDFNRQTRLIDSQDPLLPLQQTLHKIFPNIYDLLYGSDGTIFAIEGQHPLTILWEGNNKLIITYPASVKIYRQDKNWQAVTISYDHPDKHP
jgi:hypothetical protein